MAETITCPMCQADVALERGTAKALCADCHDMSDEEMAAEVQKRVDRALWAAVRAVEDQAAYVRWAVTNGKPTPRDADQSTEAADLLRKVLAARR